MIERTIIRDVDGFPEKGRKKWNEDSPTHERMRKNNNWYGKYVNYTKLKRYLRSRVGDKWDDVYSDISHKYPEWKEAIKSSWTVNLNVRVKNGIVYRAVNPKYFDFSIKVEGFYVLDGKLCYQGR